MTKTLSADTAGSGVNQLLAQALGQSKKIVFASSTIPISRPEVETEVSAPGTVGLR